MDLAALGKKAIFIPTPGQTEQEYLGRTLKEKQIAFSMSQRAFHLETALQESMSYSGFSESRDGYDLLEKAIQKVLKTEEPIYHHA